MTGPTPTRADMSDRTTDPLQSWLDCPAKTAIQDFLKATTSEGSSDFVPVAERVAVFDNDGTLWTEKPMLPEVAFAIARLHDLAPSHPEWALEEPFRSALSGDMESLARRGLPGLVQLVLATQAETTLDEFRVIVTAWLESARHPRWARPYSRMTYKPMLEVLRLCLTQGYQCYVASAGGVEFLRAWTTRIYGLSPDRVIRSTLELAYRIDDGRADFRQVPKVASFTNGAQKAAAIASTIGRRPLAAFGNSDGDYEMLQYATTGAGRRLGVLIHHDDADREYAYDRSGEVGGLDRALDDAAANQWAVVSMKYDWVDIFA